jgi:hypothetical protein
MNDDNNGFVILLVALILFMPVIHFFGMESGEDKGKNQGIVLCMEQPQKCKISYEYLKLQENQK